MLSYDRDATGVGLPTDLRGGEVGASASTSPRVAPETNHQAASPRKRTRPVLFPCQASLLESEIGTAIAFKKSGLLFDQSGERKGRIML